MFVQGECVKRGQERILEKKGRMLEGVDVGVRVLGSILEIDIGI